MRPPKNIPDVGDKVQLRDGSNAGIIRRVNHEKKWAYVDWSDGPGPFVCQLYDLQNLLTPCAKTAYKKRMGRHLAKGPPHDPKNLLGGEFGPVG